MEGNVLLSKGLKGVVEEGASPEPRVFKSHGVFRGVHPSPETKPVLSPTKNSNDSTEEAILHADSDTGSEVSFHTPRGEEGHILFTSEMEDLLESTLSAAKDLMKGLQVYNKDSGKEGPSGNGWRILDELEAEEEHVGRRRAAASGANADNGAKEGLRENENGGAEPRAKQKTGLSRKPRQSQDAEEGSRRSGKTEQAGSNPRDELKMGKEDVGTNTEDSVLEPGTSVDACEDDADEEAADDDIFPDCEHELSAQSSRNIRRATTSLKPNKWTDGIFSPRVASTRPADANPWIDPILSPADELVDDSPGAVLRRTPNGLSPEEALRRWGPPQEFSYRKRDAGGASRIAEDDDVSTLRRPGGDRSSDVSVRTPQQGARSMDASVERSGGRSEPWGEGGEGFRGTPAVQGRMSVHELGRGRVGEEMLWRGGDSGRGKAVAGVGASPSRLSMTQTRLAAERVGVGSGLSLGADLSAGKPHHNTFKWLNGAGVGRVEWRMGESAQSEEDGEGGSGEEEAEAMEQDGEAGERVHVEVGAGEPERKEVEAPPASEVGSEKVGRRQGGAVEGGAKGRGEALAQPEAEGDWGVREEEGREVGMDEGEEEGEEEGGAMERMKEDVMRAAAELVAEVLQAQMLVTDLERDMVDEERSLQGQGNGGQQVVSADDWNRQEEEHQMVTELKESLEQERRNSQLLRTELLNAAAQWGQGDGSASDGEDTRIRLEVQKEVTRGLIEARHKIFQMEKERDSALQAARLAYAHALEETRGEVAKERAMLEHQLKLRIFYQRQALNMKEQLVNERERSRQLERDLTLLHKHLSASSDAPPSQRPAPPLPNPLSQSMPASTSAAPRPHQPLPPPQTEPHPPARPQHRHPPRRGPVQQSYQALRPSFAPPRAIPAPEVPQDRQPPRDPTLTPIAVTAPSLPTQPAPPASSVPGAHVAPPPSAEATGEPHSPAATPDPQQRPRKKKHSYLPPLEAPPPPPPGRHEDPDAAEQAAVAAVPSSESSLEAPPPTAPAPATASTAAALADDRKEAPSPSGSGRVTFREGGGGSVGGALGSVRDGRAMSSLTRSPSSKSSRSAPSQRARSGGTGVMLGASAAAMDLLREKPEEALFALVRRCAAMLYEALELDKGEGEAAAAVRGRREKLFAELATEGVDEVLASCCRAAEPEEGLREAGGDVRLLATAMLHFLQALPRTLVSPEVLAEFQRSFEAAAGAEQRSKALLGVVKARFAADGPFLELFVQVLWLASGVCKVCEKQTPMKVAASLGPFLVAGTGAWGLLLQDEAEILEFFVAHYDALFEGHLAFVAEEHPTAASQGEADVDAAAGLPGGGGPGEHREQEARGAQGGGRAKAMDGWDVSDEDDCIVARPPDSMSRIDMPPPSFPIPTVPTVPSSPGTRGGGAR